MTCTKRVTCTRSSHRRSGRHDLVVLDINMPGGTVHDTLGGLRDLHPELPILVLSGEASPPDDLPLTHADLRSQADRPR